MQKDVGSEPLQIVINVLYAIVDNVPTWTIGGTVHREWTIGVITIPQTAGITLSLIGVQLPVF